MHPEFWFVIYVFAVYRLSEAASHDQILDTVRRSIAKRAAAGKRVWIWVSDWIHCSLCIGVWFSFPAAFLYSLGVLGSTEISYILVIWFGMAGMQYLLSSLTLPQDPN